MLTVGKKRFRDKYTESKQYIPKRVSLILALSFGKKIWKIWFKEFTVSDIYIAQIKICAINQFRKGEGSENNTLSTRSNYLKSLSPLIFDNDEVFSSLWRK